MPVTRRCVSKEVVMYQVNDHVVYGNHGICEVKAIGTLNMDNADRKRLYYTLEPMYTRNNKVYTPVDNVKSAMRRAVTEKEAWELIDSLTKQEMIEVPDEKKREQAYKEIMQQNDCGGWSRVIKTIYIKNKRRLAEGKRYTARDDVYLRVAEDFLFRELAAALNKDKDEIKDIIAGRIKE